MLQMVLKTLWILSATEKNGKRTSLHSAARELKMPIAPGRPVFCLHPQRARRRGVVPPPPATLEVFKMLPRERGLTPGGRRPGEAADRPRWMRGARPGAAPRRGP